MLINKNSNLKRLSNLDYLYEEKVNTNEDIVIDLNDRIVFQEGIKTTKSIKSNVTIISRYGIEAGGGIEAGFSIKAGG